MTLLEFGREQKAQGIESTLDKVWEMIAGQLGVGAVIVKKWAYKERRVADTHVIPLEEITHGAVPRYITRPDIYPVGDYYTERHAKAV